MRRKFTVLTVLLFSTTSLFAQKYEYNGSRELENNYSKIYLKTPKNNEDFNENPLNPLPFNFLINNEKVIHKSAISIRVLLDSSLYYMWVDTLSQWTFDSKDEYYYDINGNLIQFVNYRFDENLHQLVFNSKDEYTYDNNGNITQHTENYWDEIKSQWVGGQKYEYTYNVTSDVIVYINSRWNEIFSKWIQSIKSEYIYNDNGEITQQIGYNWNETNSQWVSHVKEEYTYNSNGETTQYLRNGWDETINQWIPSDRFEYRLDEKGNVIQRIDYYWNKTNNEWEGGYATVNINYTYDNNGNVSQIFDNNEKTEYKYDSNDNLIQTIRYGWNESISQWIPNRKDENTFDSNNRVIQNIELHYLNFKNISELDSAGYKTEYEYDVNGNVIQSVDYYLNTYTSSDEWGLRRKEINYYSEHNATKVPMVNNKDINIFPNPVSQSLTINFGNNHNCVNFNLFDIQGRKIISKDIRNQEKISLEDLNNGMYFYNISTSDGKKRSGKLIKE